MTEERKGFFEGDQRMWFLFGLVTGIALMALIGGGINFGGGSGARAANNNAGTGTGTQQVIDAGTGQAAPMPEVTDEDHVLGDLKKAKVVLVEYADFECPYCNRHHVTMKQLKEEYGDDIAWIYRHFPLTSIHPNATPAAIASECAAEQGEDKFWEYADILVDNYQNLNDATYDSAADQVGLNKNKFEDCLANNDYAADIAAEAQGGMDAGVTGTPATFINGTLVSGAVPIESLRTAIDQILAQ